jgi:hypothetical protein
MMQMTGKDTLSWTFVRMQITVGDNVYKCSIAGGDPCEITQQGGDISNSWEPGEYVLLSENGVQICDEVGCLVGISVVYNGNTVAGAGNTVVD